MSASIPTQYTGYGAKDEANGKKLDLEVVTCKSRFRTHLAAR